MAITEIFGGLFKTQTPKEKTKAEKALSALEFKKLLEQLTGNQKVLLNSSHSDRTRVDGHCVVDSVKGNYVALCNRQENKFYFIEIAKIVRFDITQDFAAYKSTHFYEVKP